MDMDSDIKKICGVDLSDYFLVKNSYNPIVYIHKKYLPKENNKGKNIKKKYSDLNKNDKSQQYDCNKVHCDTYGIKNNNTEYEDPLLEQTIRFAKGMIPLTVPPSTTLNNQVYYTVKPCKKNKRKHESYGDNKKHDKTFDIEKSKHAVEIVKPEKCKRTKENTSARSVSQFSPNNTIDDINENQSLSYSLSEMSDRRNFKKEEFTHINKKHETQKIVASESFEAIAAEYMNTLSDSKIKIHLMNENEKNLLCENIRTPLINAIKECFTETNQPNEINVEIQNIHKSIQSQTNKLDRIYERLSCIEKKLKAFETIGSTSIDKIKSSKLEELGQDIVDIKEDLTSEEELACVNLTKKSRSRNTPIISIMDAKDTTKDVEKLDDMAKGEHIPESYKASTSKLGIKPERPNRIPARFCWTDAVRNN